MLNHAQKVPLTTTQSLGHVKQQKGLEMFSYRPRRKRKWVWLSPQCSPIQFDLLITKYPSFSQAKGIFITSPKGTPKVSSVIAVISNSRISQWYITSLLESGFGFLSHCHHPLPLQNTHTHTHTHNTVVKQGWGKYIKFTHLAKGIEDNRR